MRRTAALLLAALVLVVACGDDGAGGGDGATSSTTTAPDLPEQVAVFGPDGVETDVYGNEVTWTPGTEAVAAAEALLADRLVEEADRGVDELGAYARQYVGIGAGDEQVTVNALCAVDDLDWQDQYLVVADGGSCFWQATVDLTTATIAPFTVNGVA